MKVEDLNFSYKDLLIVLDARSVRKMIDYKLTQAGYLKSTDMATKENVSRQAISLRVNGPKPKYETVDFGGYVYIKKLA